MEGILEVHGHIICTASDRKGWYCGFVYMDGRQCTETWTEYPMRQGDGSRTFTREAVRAWIAGGGVI